MHQDEQELLRLIEKLQEILDELLEEERTVTSFQSTQREPENASRCQSNSALRIAA